jgi:glycosyltransferase involved in cell wall biosynthesis
VGRLSREKNLIALVEAVAGLSVSLLLVGNGPQSQELAELSLQLNVPMNLAGNIPNHDLPALLNDADAFVLPSLYEGHPKALLEAMACGLPVIGSDVSGIRELIQHGENGLLCPPTAVGIREALEVLMADAALRSRLGKNARKFAVENFSLQKIVELEWTVLRELAG